jgi:hypothetical protein
MSLSASVGVQIPTNVVEVGNEISQNSINALAAASSPATLNPFMTSNAVSATYATKASPTFTGTVTIPAGASISGYLTTASASSTYQTQAGMSSYATTSWAQGAFASKFDPATGNYGAVYEAPNDGSEYVRKNQAWAVATGGGGGGLTISSLSNAAATTLDATAPTTGQALTFDGTELAWATVGGGGVAWGGITGTVTDQTDLVSYITGLGYITSVPAKTLNTISGTSYQLAAGDENKVHLLTGGMSGATLVLPADSTYAFPNGTEITVVSDDTSMTNMNISGQFAGQPTVNGLWSLTLTNKVNKLVKIGTDLWLFT